MCGIVGLIDFTAPAVHPDVIREATDALHNRGPDDSGCWVQGQVGFGHRRLSILDLSSASHQPFISKNKRYVLVFNGEIYNYRKLREQIGSGFNWQTDGDAEVIVAAYQKWGVDCLSHFHGMFSFAIWDNEKKCLFAARDRMGVKPFYYHHSSQCFAFASRPRSLFCLKNDISEDIDPQALRYYLESGYIPAPYSIHRSIKKLPPAHYLLFENEKLRIERYWDFRKIRPEQNWVNRAEDDLLDELDEIISRSVQLRMVSDVPLGAFLSGGIDSSLVVAMMAKYTQNSIKTFTIGFDDPKYNESQHAQAVSEYLGTEHYCETLRVDDLIELMPVFIREYDEPFFDYSAFPTLAVSRTAKKHVTVSLSGDGGDELFGGYHYYEIIRKLTPLYRFPIKLRLLLSKFIKMMPSHKASLLAGAVSQSDIAAAFAFSRSISKDYPSVLSKEIDFETKSLSDLFTLESNDFCNALSASEKAMRLDAIFTLPDDYLQKVDLGSMAFSLESREPLLDQDIVEWAMKLPVQWKLKNGTNKYLLRKLAYRYVPENILNRPKQGFGAPVDAWLRGPLKKWAMERIYDYSIYEKLGLNRSVVINLFELHISGKRNAHPLLWAILMLFEYCSTYCEKSNIGDLR